MSDTTNVMKGARSGVQKLIKRGKPHLNDAGCIRCHLVDLFVKAGMAALPVDIDQLFFTSIITLKTVAKEINSLVICGIPSIITNPKFS